MNDKLAGIQINMIGSKILIYHNMYIEVERRIYDHVMILQVYGEVLDTTRLIAVLLEHGSLDKKAVSQTNNPPEIYQCLTN